MIYFNDSEKHYCFSLPVLLPTLWKILLAMRSTVMICICGAKNPWELTELGNKILGHRK